MPVSMKWLGLESLRVNDRMTLALELWESIEKPERDLLMPEWHLQEIERRIKAANADLDAGIPWEVIESRLADRS